MKFEARAVRTIRKGERFLVSLPAKIRRMNPIDKRRELADIDTTVMPIKKHRWFGDVLVAQSRQDGKWAVFWPESGRSDAASSYREAVRMAKTKR